MNKKVAIIISPNWKDYAEKYLSECIASIRKQDYAGEIKVYLADNETGPESFDFLKKTAPEAELVLNKENDGFAKGNNDCIALALARGFEYIILFNMDTVIAPDCVSEMVKTAESGEKIGAVQARLMLYSEKNKINSMGNSTHFLGFGYCLGYKKKFTNYQPKADPPREDKLQITNYIHYPSGAAVLYKSEVLKKVGIFDEEYWMYNEDQELGWRIWLGGYKCVLAPKAVVYHKYEFAKSIRQFYYLDRNRIITILTCYHILTLLLIMPAFVIMELGLVLFSFKTGWFKEKLRVWKYFLIVKNWKYLLRARKRNQGLRRIKDSDIAELLSGRIWYQEIDDKKLRIINPVFNLYWRIIRKIIIW